MAGTPAGETTVAQITVGTKRKAACGEFLVELRDPALKTTSCSMADPHLDAPFR